MKDIPLRLQILEYLKENGGEENNIDIKTPFSNFLSDMDGRKKYLKAINDLLEDDYIKLTDTSYGFMAFESGGIPQNIEGVSILAKLKKTDKPTIGNVHIGDNYGNYSQLSRSEKSHVSPAQIKNKPDTINIILTAIGIIVAITGVYFAYLQLQ